MPPPQIDEIRELVVERKDILWQHGWALWASWGVLGFIQLLSLRYLKAINVCGAKTRRITMFIHIFSGTIITIVTIVMSLLAIEYYSWRLLWSESLHSALGIAILIVTTLVTLIGYLAWGASFYPKKLSGGGFWNLVHSLKFKAIH